jgi:hypothetical protein
MGERFYATSTLDNIARKTLKDYNGFYLYLAPQPVPLERIIEDNFGITIEYMRLTESGNELGRMICDDGYSTRFNAEKKVITNLWGLTPAPC